MSNQNSLLGLSKAPDLPEVQPELKVGIIPLPNFTLVSLASLTDGLRLAADIKEHSRQIFITWDILACNKQPISSSCGIVINPQKTIDSWHNFDVIVVVGGLLPASAFPDDEIIACISKAYESSIQIAGLCTGTFALARAGLLDSRMCAVYPGIARYLSELFPTTILVTEQAVLAEGTIYTCQGGTSGLELAHRLVKTTFGKEFADKCMELKPLNHGRDRSDKAPPWLRRFEHLEREHLVHRAITCMTNSPSGYIGVNELSNLLRVSERNLNRAFRSQFGKPPSTVSRELRLDRGRWELINKSKSVTKIAVDCGFSDSAHFGRWFKQRYGETPVQYRKVRKAAARHVER